MYQFYRSYLPMQAPPFAYGFQNREFGEYLMERFISDNTHSILME